MKIRVYLACLIAKFQIPKFDKKLYHQSKLLPVANKFNKSRYESFSNNCAFLFLLTFLFFRWFLSRFISRDIGEVSNQLVSACYIIHLKMKVRLIAKHQSLISAIQLSDHFLSVFALAGLFQISL